MSYTHESRIPNRASFEVLDQKHQAPVFSHRFFIYFGSTVCCLALTLVAAISLGLLGSLVPLIAYPLALVPGACILAFFYLRPGLAYHGVGLERLVKFITLGMVLVLPVLIAEMGIGSIVSSLQARLSFLGLFAGLLGAFLQSFLVAAFCEETLKFTVAALATKLADDKPYSIFLLSVAGAVGMASLENLEYTLLGDPTNAVATGFTLITRAIVSVPMHAVTGALIGVSVAKYRFGIESITYTRNEDLNKVLFYLRTLAEPVLIHGVFDFVLFSAGLFEIGAYMMLIMLFNLLLVIAAAVYMMYRRRQVMPDAVDKTSYSPIVNIG